MTPFVRLDPGELPTRESEAAEWFEAAIMLLVKDGLDLQLTGRGQFRMSTIDDTVFDVGQPARVVGDLDGTVWTAEHAFDVGKGWNVTGFSAKTPEGSLVAEGPIEREWFPVAGVFRLTVSLQWRPLIPISA